jgi:hypothetical protein
MSILTESSTIDEVILAIESGQVHDFLEIPQQYQSESLAFAWLDKARIGGIWLDNGVDNVPSEFRTPRFMLLAAEKGCPVLYQATPEKYQNYREIALASITKNISQLGYLDPCFREEMLEHAQKVWPKHLFYMADMNEWFFESMSDDLLDKSVRGDSLLALIAPAHRLREPLHRYINLNDLSTRMGLCSFICRNSLLPMLATKVREGEWFDGYFEDMPTKQIPRPDSLESGVMELGKRRPDDSEGETILMAYIMSHPIADVVPAMKDIRLKKFLLEMYSKVELEPFMKEDVGLRGAMLEGALGL